MAPPNDEWFGGVLADIVRALNSRGDAALADVGSEFRLLVNLLTDDLRAAAKAPDAVVDNPPQVAVPADAVAPAADPSSSDPAPAVQ